MRDEGNLTTLHAPSASTANRGRLVRFYRGLFSNLRSLVLPLGKLLGSRLNHLKSAERLERGLVLVLPGVDGESFLNHDIAWGLADGGVTAAIEIFDWTTGCFLLFIYHLCSWRRNLAWAERLAIRIVEYRSAYPGRPVHLVGHSGGAAMAILAVERLPAGQTVTSAILICAALSPQYNLTRALQKIDRGIWNYHSRVDIMACVIATVLLGTMDRLHVVAAGNIGFVPPANLTPDARELYGMRLRAVPFRAAMITSFNIGEHFSATNRVFVAEWIAPLLTGLEADHACDRQERRMDHRDIR